MDSSTVLLLSMPWSRMDNLSIQLGVLKAFLVSKGIKTESRHYYKDLAAYIGLDLYQECLEKNLGEAVFSVFLDGAKRKQVKNLLKKKISCRFNFDKLCRDIKRFVEDIIADIDWACIDLVGFSTSLVQLMSSVVLASALKKRFASIKIVFGGASLIGEMAQGLAAAFDVIDFVVKGEGEVTLYELAVAVRQRQSDLSKIKGLIYRQNGKLHINPDRELIPDLSSLPTPDFEDFFRYALKGETASYYPKITVESSRGCFWSRCAFCNLNAQWYGRYRSKKIEDVIREIDRQTIKYGILDIFFTDSNISDKVALFRGISTLQRDYCLHGEVSGHLTKDDFVAMRKAGMVDIQIGIEAFSSSLLRKYNKGVTVMRNIEMLKWCAELGVKVFYNVITGFPDTSPQEVEETLQNMRYARYFQPPVLTGYSVSYKSHVYENFRNYNMREYRIPRSVKDIYPRTVLEKIAPLLLTIVGYDPVVAQERLVDWNEVIEFVVDWEEAHKANGGQPGLMYRDGRNFLVVEKKLPAGQERFIIPEPCRSVYIFCSSEAKSHKEVLSNFPEVSESALEAYLNELCQMEIMFKEDDKFFSLAVHET